jgi:hypothetical protein
MDKKIEEKDWNRSVLTNIKLDKNDFQKTCNLPKHVCSFCGNGIDRKNGLLICDNDCGRKYCSDRCADNDDNHKCG